MINVQLLFWFIYFVFIGQFTLAYSDKLSKMESNLCLPNVHVTDSWQSKTTKEDGEDLKSYKL